MGLCKAAATDKGGCFSTYAYRLIWHEICDALVYATRRQAVESVCDATPFMPDTDAYAEELSVYRMDVYQALETAKKKAPPSTAKGIDALCLMSRGYTCREIGERMDASDKLVAAWISKARKFLKAEPGLKALAAEYHS